MGIKRVMVILFFIASILFVSFNVLSVYFSFGRISGASSITGQASQPAGFSVDKSILKIMIKRGESFKTSIIIRNLEGTNQNFILDAAGLSDKVLFSEESFMLGPEEERGVYITFVSALDTVPDIYAGRIIIKAEDYESTLPVILEIKSKQILFDASLDISPKYKQVLSGENLTFQATLFNLGDLEKSDISVEYQIKDFEGNTIFREREFVIIETQTSFLHTIQLPDDLKEGGYVLSISAVYGDFTGFSSDIFNVAEKKSIVLEGEYLLMTVVFVMIILAVAGVFYFTDKRLKAILETQTEEVRKVSERISRGGIKIKEAAGLNERLAIQSSLLDKAYSKGYITSHSYSKGEKRIENLRKS